MCKDRKFYNCVRNKCIHKSYAKSLVGALESFYWWKRKIYADIDVIICPSAFMKQMLDTECEIKNKTIVLHNPLPSNGKRNVNGGKYVLYFGRYSIEKGIRTLLSVAHENLDIQFVFAGSGPLKSEVTGTNIMDVGFLSGDRLTELVQSASLTVCPSEWYENCPMSVLESIAAGTPVLGANIGGIPELIVSGKNGELFESGNRIDLSRKLRVMLNNNYDCSYDTNIITDIATHCNTLVNRIYNS